MSSQLKYYSEALHKAAFILPGWLIHPPSPSPTYHTSTYQPIIHLPLHCTVYLTSLANIYIERLDDDISSLLLLILPLITQTITQRLHIILLTEMMTTMSSSLRIIIGAV